MPRPGPRRPLVALRLAEEEIEKLDELAEEAGGGRSAIIRTFIEQGLERTGPTEKLELIRRSVGESDTAEYVTAHCGDHDADESRMLLITRKDGAEIYFCAENGTLVQGSPVQA